MAEAHQAVAFQFAVTDEGISVHFDRDAVKAALRAFLGANRRRYFRTKIAILNGVFPASPLSLAGIVVVVGLLYCFGFDPTFSVLGGLGGLLGTCARLLLLLFLSVVLWVVFSYAQRYTLKGLLIYKGWMFDPRGKPSRKTKVWSILVKLVTGPAKPLLYSYQNSLPRLPVPRLEDTCRRYLESVRPLVDDERYEELEGLAKKFKNGPGKKIQRYLCLKSWWATNYVTDWWEEYVYLHGRSSIMINSNYYACDSITFDLTTNPAARSGILCHSMMLLKQDIENGRLKPLILQGIIPLCSVQYERLFGTTRIPGQEADKLVTYKGEESRHVVVYCRGRWYRVDLYHKKRLLEPVQIEWIIQQILDDNAAEVGPGEEHLGALTATDRKTWAEAREQYFMKDAVNKKSMETIEKAAFVIILDDTCPTSLCKDGNCEDLSSYCQELMHGKGYNRWFDKSFTVVMFGNAKLGMNAEHSWADAPIIGHLLEYCCNLEHQLNYREDGHCHGKLEFNPPGPKRLQWNIPPEAVGVINTAVDTAQVQVEDLDLYVLQHTAFGKGDMKKCKISPDAFVQMALQLAYFKDSGEEKLCLTYEASMTRLYLEGRTETVRPVTVESAAFVKAMCDPKRTDKERRALLFTAVEKHALSYKQAMTGEGVDRHLFCLYVMSKYLKIEDSFLGSVLWEPWRLSTSQTPTQQTGKVDFNREPDKISPGGGFGPVTQDGYGVSYIIPGDYVIYFHVSSFKSSSHTDSRRFASRIQECLADIRALFTEVVNQH